MGTLPVTFSYQLHYYMHLHEKKPFGTRFTSAPKKMYSTPSFYASSNLFNSEILLKNKNRINQYREQSLLSGSHPRNCLIFNDFLRKSPLGDFSPNVYVKINGVCVGTYLCVCLPSSVHVRSTFQTFRHQVDPTKYL